MLQRRLQSNPLELAKSLRNLSTGCQPSLWVKIQENKIPLLLLVGERDPKFISINAEMESLCDVAQLEIVHNCGHNIHFENVHQFVEKTSIFLASKS
jgi:2-succinyl-6-hydroxy-2,4-cyclohexadiene-1-carboxylate synthase